MGSKQSKLHNGPELNVGETSHTAVDEGRAQKGHGSFTNLEKKIWRAYTT